MTCVCAEGEGCYLVPDEGLHVGAFGQLTVGGWVWQAADNSG